MVKYAQLIAAFIFLLMATGQVGTDIYLPSLPSIASALHTEHRYVQWSIGFFYLSYSITQLFYGPLADRYGRRLPMLVALSIYAIGSVLAMLAPTIHALLIGRLVQGIGAGGCTVLPRAIMRDTFSGKELQKINIYQQAVWSMMFLLAPLFGGYIEEYIGWRANFACILLFAVISLIACFFFKERYTADRSHSLKAHHIIKEYISIIRHPGFWPSLIGCSAASAIFVTFIVFIAIFLPKTLHFTPINFGWTTLFIALGYLTGLILSRIYIHRVRAIVLIRMGLFINFFATACMLIFGIWFTQSMWCLITLFLFEVSNALIFPSMMAATLNLFPHKAGKASAIIGCVVFISNLLGSLIASFLPNNTWLYLSLTYIVFAGILWFSFVHLHRYQRTAQDIE